MQNGFEEAAAFGLGGGELRFQPVAQGHQFVYFCDDSVLFGEGWKGDSQRTNVVEIQPRLPRTISTLNQFGSSSGRCHQTKQKPAGKTCCCGFNQSNVLTHICLA